MEAHERLKVQPTHTGPLVSVVIPFLDAEPYIGEAIESVLAQTYEHWELILVDDGSTDRSAEVARAVTARKSERVTYLTHPGKGHRGLSASRNLGLERARGDLVAFLDADDVWLPRKLEEQVALLQRYPHAAAVYGLSEYWVTWAGDGGSDSTPDLGVEPGGVILPPKLLVLALQSRARTPPPSSILLRTSAAVAVGGFEESFTDMYEDQAFLAKLYLRYPVLVAERCWARYRIRSDSLTGRARASGQRERAGLRYLDWLVAYLEQHGYDDAELWRALRRKRLRYRHPRLNRLFLFLHRHGIVL